MKRRGVWCITGSRTKVKGSVLAILGKGDLGDPLNHIHDVRSRW
jgi:hypothetical protein